MLFIHLIAGNIFYGERNKCWSCNGNRTTKEAETVPTIGLALGSGGARGWCHIGALRELHALGFAPSVIAGCSMGALVGAAYVVGALDELEEWAHDLNWCKMARHLDINIAGGGLIDGKIHHPISQLQSAAGPQARNADCCNHIAANFTSITPASAALAHDPASKSSGSGPLSPIRRAPASPPVPASRGPA